MARKIFKWKGRYVSIGKVLTKPEDRMKTIIDEEVYEAAQEAKRKLGKQGTVAKKVQAVMVAYKHGITKASEILEVSKSSIYYWSKELKEGEYENLINKSKHQDGLKLKKVHKEEMWKWLEESPNMTIKEVRIRLEEELGVQASKSTVHRAMQEGGYAYITPRKKHYKQDKEKVEEFKKKSSE